MSVLFRTTLPRFLDSAELGVSFALVLPRWCVSSRVKASAEVFAPIVQHRRGQSSSNGWVLKSPVTTAKITRVRDSKRKNQTLVQCKPTDKEAKRTRLHYGHANAPMLRCPVLSCRFFPLLILTIIPPRVVGRLYKPLQRLISPMSSLMPCTEQPKQTLRT